MFSPALAQKHLEALPPGASYVGDEVILKLEPGASLKSPRLYTADVRVDAQATAALATLDVTILKVPQGKVPQVVADLKQSPAVEFAEPNYLVQAIVITPNDPDWVNQYGPIHVQAPQA